MPTLRQLRYLVAVADTLSFRRAAALCHVTQPTLSEQLQGLEARLGARLVERSRHKVGLSPVAPEAAERARAGRAGPRPGAAAPPAPRSSSPPSAARSRSAPAGSWRACRTSSTWPAPG